MRVDAGSNCGVYLVGTPGAIRTRNLEIRSLSLYPLSYGGAILPVYCDSSACFGGVSVAGSPRCGRDSTLGFDAECSDWRLLGLSECEHSCWVVYLHHVYCFCIYAVCAHSGDDSCCDVVPTVSAVTL